MSQPHFLFDFFFLQFPSRWASTSFKYRVITPIQVGWNSRRRGYRLPHVTPKRTRLYPWWTPNLPVCWICNLEGTIGCTPATVYPWYLACVLGWDSWWWKNPWPYPRNIGLLLGISHRGPVLSFALLQRCWWVIFFRDFPYNQCIVWVGFI